jgi:acetyl esterase/lipase
MINGGEKMFRKSIVLGFVIGQLALLPFSVNAADFICGDVNGDSVIDSADYTVLRSYLLGKTTTLASVEAADTNSDGVVDSADYTVLRKYLLEIIKSLPLGGTSSPTPTITKTPTPTNTNTPTPTNTNTPTPKPIKVPVNGDTIDTSSINTKYMNIAYGHISSRQTLDIYIPNEGKGPFPVIIAIHGGAFNSGNSVCSQVVSMVEGGINHGYAVVSLNYRLVNEAKFPGAINDVKAAVRFVKANAAKYNLNTDKLVAWGDSSGGNLVTMIGTSANVSSLDGDNKDNLNYTSDVKAVIDWFGHNDFLKIDEQFAQSGITNLFGNTTSPNSVASVYMGKGITVDPTFTQKANPETYIPTMDVAKAPYFFIQHGSKDNIVPVQQSINLASKLKAAIGENKVTLDIIEGAMHNSYEFGTPENIKKVFAFLDKVIK